MLRHRHYRLKQCALLCQPLNIFSLERWIAFFINRKYSTNIQNPKKYILQIYLYIYRKATNSHVRSWNQNKMAVVSLIFSIYQLTVSALETVWFGFCKRIGVGGRWRTSANWFLVYRRNHQFKLFYSLILITVSALVYQILDWIAAWLRVELVHNCVRCSCSTQNLYSRQPLMPGPQMCPVAFCFTVVPIRCAFFWTHRLSPLELLQQQPGNTNNCLCAGGL